MFPEEGIAGFIYPAVLNDGFAKGRASLFGPALPSPIHEQVEGPVADSMNFENWHTGPLRMAVLDPYRKVDLAWQGARIRFDGRFEALHPPYAFSLHPAGNPPYYGGDRTEQRLFVAVVISAPHVAVTLNAGIVFRTRPFGLSSRQNAAIMSLGYPATSTCSGSGRHPALPGARLVDHRIGDG